MTTDGVAPGTGINGGNILRYCGKVPHTGAKTPFAPRIGINYRIDDKTVVRGGYGIFFDSFEGREIDDSADIYPYSIRNNLTPATVASAPKNTNQLFHRFRPIDGDLRRGDGPAENAEKEKIRTRNAHRKPQKTAPLHTAIQFRSV